MNNINSTLSKPHKAEEMYVLITSLLLAWLLAAHSGTQYDGYNRYVTYLYWSCRIFIELAVFSAVFLSFEKYLINRLSMWLRFALSILCSLVPFALLITAFDLVVGLPELGLDDTLGEPVSRGREFGFELFYLLDNHSLFCVLILLPRILPNLLKGTQSNDINVEAVSSAPSSTTAAPVMSFLETLTPSMQGPACCMEAQEHYIQITTANESRMVLQRFSDAVSSMPASQGMQVHRSHWVAHSAVKEMIIEGQSMKLRLSCGKLVPVSRTFRTATEKRYALSR